MNDRPHITTNEQSSQTNLLADSNIENDICSYFGEKTFELMLTAAIDTASFEKSPDSYFISMPTAKDNKQKYYPLTKREYIDFLNLPETKNFFTLRNVASAKAEDIYRLLCKKQIIKDEAFTLANEHSALLLGKNFKEFSRLTMKVNFITICRNLAETLQNKWKESYSFLMPLSSKPEIIVSLLRNTGYVIASENNKYVYITDDFLELQGTDIPEVIQLNSTSTSSVLTLDVAETEENANLSKAKEIVNHIPPSNAIVYKYSSNNNLPSTHKSIANNFSYSRRQDGIIEVKDHFKPNGNPDTVQYKQEMDSHKNGIRGLVRAFNKRKLAFTLTSAGEQLRFYRNNKNTTTSQNDAWNEFCRELQLNFKEFTSDHLAEEDQLHPRIINDMEYRNYALREMRGYKSINDIFPEQHKPLLDNFSYSRNQDGIIDIHDKSQPTDTPDNAQYKKQMQQYQNDIRTIINMFKSKNLAFTLTSSHGKLRLYRNSNDLKTPQNKAWEEFCEQSPLGSKKDFIFDRLKEKDQPNPKIFNKSQYQAYLKNEEQQMQKKRKRDDTDDMPANQKPTTTPLQIYTMFPAPMHQPMQSEVPHLPSDGITQSTSQQASAQNGFSFTQSTD